MAREKGKKHSNRRDEGFHGRRPNRRHDGGRGSDRASRLREQLYQEDFNFDEWVSGYEVTQPDLDNMFGVYMKYYNLGVVSGTLRSYTVYGRQTVGELGKIVGFSLWFEDKIPSPGCDLDLFREEDGKKLCSDELLAKLLKDTQREHLGHGVFLYMKCRVKGLWGEDCTY